MIHQDIYAGSFLCNVERPVCPASVDARLWDRIEVSHARGSLHQARTYDGIGAVGRCMALYRLQKDLNSPERDLFPAWQVIVGQEGVGMGGSRGR